MEATWCGDKPVYTSWPQEEISRSVSWNRHKLKCQDVSPSHPLTQIHFLLKWKALRHKRWHASDRPEGRGSNKPAARSQSSSWFQHTGRVMCHWCRWGGDILAQEERKLLTVCDLIHFNELVYGEVDSLTWELLKRVRVAIAVWAVWPWVEVWGGYIVSHGHGGKHSGLWVIQTATEERKRPARKEKPC